MHFISSSQGPVVVLIHGLFGDLDNLKALAKSLESHYRVIRIDVPNHGKSEHGIAMNYPLLAQKVITLLDNESIEHVHLVGHSMGGKIAMAMALDNPSRVNSLVIADIAPVAYASSHTQDVLDTLLSVPLEQIKDRRAAQTHLMENGVDEHTALFLLKSLIKQNNNFIWKMDVGQLKRSYNDIIDWPYHDKKYTGPSLCIRGEESDYVKKAYTQDIIRQFPAIEARTILGAGHWLHAQKPLIFNRLVKDFLDRQSN
ncbi:alpha/beta fold hydrolase [uncultured Shewanella sp.]|uniref:alpha/beta fold hydrolase n=1 Tax=uncultured Shewanella sp. TaxID=173975 RepID=UPI002615EC5E|nr:alpha/beta fold hydrolase [uncultured Shewanella sp.]